MITDERPTDSALRLDIAIGRMERGQVRALQLVELLERAQSDLQDLLAYMPPHAHPTRDLVATVTAAWRARDLLMSQLKAENADDIAKWRDLQP